MTTDLDLNERLADAASAAPDQLGVTIGELRRRGASRRRTRAGVASAAAALVVAGGAFAVAGGEPAPIAAPGGPSPSPSLSAIPVTDLPRVYISLSPSGTVELGEPVGNASVSLWFAEADARFVMVFGIRDDAGRLVLQAVESDPDVTPPGPGDVGFHAGFTTFGGDSQFLLGYLVAPAGHGPGAVAKVSLTIDGVPTTAETSAWPKDPRVVAWWVRLPAGTAPPDVTGLTAVDERGTVIARVPAGLR
ncbi:hypothetical protein KZZ52_09150 [Dactylosporangium sp. AC04546]|uniref:hypothetical protein n=1 Tax=Dactylosporangium sp. AC04546 TaxID=2862460 RepID=UPI001EDDA323|nr:hypothetical protein [Dactylosporangium sp. AC04546]WVK85534.1 hypothetical protein KZZ52_09150 [Dactylosporangium sp. AC04546]